MQLNEYLHENYAVSEPVVYLYMCMNTKVYISAYVFSVFTDIVLRGYSKELPESWGCKEKLS